MTKINARRNFFILMIAIGAALSVISLFSNIYAQNATSNKTGVILTLSGTVEPTVAGYLEREIAAANDTGADLVILEIDTPGGLVTSMKDIIKSILASDIPVVTYVSPQGAQSASAGLYIMYSAHVSAMAPATNTGAATPVNIGGGDDGGEDISPMEQEPTSDEAPASEDSESASEPAISEENIETEEVTEPALDDIPAYSSEDAMRKKIINDSVAYIRSLAEKRNRNADWAERAVRDAVSITANEALELNVIDLLADDIDDLLSQIDGVVVETAAGEVTISTENMQLTKVDPQLWEVILAIITDPTIAAIFLSIGTLGITAEIWNPGSIFPGVVGLICLLLAFYSFSILPPQGLFLALLGVGALLILLEAYTPTFGIAGLMGLAIMGVGLYFLYPEEVGRVNPIAIGTILITGAIFMALLLIALVRSRGHGPLIGSEAIEKRDGVVEEWDQTKGEGLVIVDGERWRARSKNPLSAGDNIKVSRIDGLVLDVISASTNQSLSRFIPGRNKNRDDSLIT